MYIDWLIVVLRLRQHSVALYGRQSRNPGPGLPPTLFDRSQGVFILHSTIDSNTQRPALLRSTAESPKNYNYNELQL